ncbi:MAG: hypothetical protein JSV91_10345 [Phycisphaerales bacterium]|nr:MAG: hypothetical protein JSV91_10345 [Phycisphaerales bacterium]
MKRPIVLWALPLAGGAFLIAGVTEARAGFMGHTVTAEWLYPDFGAVLESHDVVVGDGVELTPADIIWDSKFSIDIGDDYVLFSFNATSNWTDTAFNGWRFTDTNGTVLDIVGYTIDEVSGGIANLYDSDLDYNTESAWANFGGVTVAGDGDYIRLKVHFIPAPAALSVLAVSGLIRRRRR